MEEEVTISILKKFIAVAILPVAFTASSLGFAQEAPTNTPRGMLHLLVDSEGRVYTKHFTKDESGQVSPTETKRSVSEEELQMLRRLGLERNTDIVLHPEAEFGKRALKSSGSCPLYQSISFWRTSGVHYGVGQQNFSSNRGAGETTQWAVGNVTTIGYGGQLSHSGVNLLDESVINGGGMILGDRSQDTFYGCGAGNPHAFQIELFACGSPCVNQKTSTTCTVTADNVAYKFAIQAVAAASPNHVSASYWLDYSSGTTWALANGLNDNASFTQLDPNGDGITVFDAVDNRSSGDYQVLYTNLNCGWF